MTGPVSHKPIRAAPANVLGLHSYDELQSYHFSRPVAAEVAARGSVRREVRENAEAAA